MKSTTFVKLISQIPIRLSGKSRVRSSLILALGVLEAGSAHAQINVTAAREHSAATEVVLTIDEAVQIALVSNLTIQNNRLDLDNARAQIKEGWAELYPQIDISSGYTRNVRTVNPFAGSQAGGFFQTLGFIDWLAYNEQTRTDGDPDSVPITVTEYFARRQAGLEAADIVVESSDNPFNIPNMYRAGVSVTQKLFDGRVIFGATGAKKWLEPMNSAAIRRQEQLLIDNVKRAFYQALLTEEQTNVLSQSVGRADRTRAEMARQVSLGTAPKFQRLSAEVELANLETQYIQAENAYAGALDDLKLLIGIPVEQQLRLLGVLEPGAAGGFIPISVEDAAILAAENRPDLEQAGINIELERIQLQVERSGFLPELNAFLNLNYVGNVPDNRSIISSDPNNPFSFSSSSNSYFSSDYWDWDMNVGFRLSWNLFDGFGTSQRIQQRKIAMNKAEMGYEYLGHSIRIEVERALRDVRAAQKRMTSQEQNVERADLNFSYAEARLREGVASPIEVREASSQLDQSRLNYLQAVHDYLVSRSAYDTAIGSPQVAVVYPHITSN